MQFAVCELYHPCIHGITSNPPKGIARHYIVKDILTIAEVMRGEHNELIEMLNIGYTSMREKLTEHPDIDNFKYIIRRPNYIKLDIVQINEMTGDDGTQWTTGCLKTHYIRLVQRRWKAYYKQRQVIIQARMHPRALRHRETTGRWLR